MGTGDEELDHLDEMLLVWAREIPALDPVAEGIVERIQILAKGFDRSMDETLVEFGLDRRSYHLLGRLRSYGAPYRRSPGQLAADMRLSSGAMTNRLDRMETAGVVQRERDATDRRRVYIKPTPNEEQTNQIKPIYASLRQALHEELAERYSPEALAAIEDFLRRTIQVLQQQTQQLSQETAK